VLAFVTNVMVLRSQEETRPVVVAASAIEAGRTLSATDFKVAEVDLEDDLFARLIPWEQASGLSGMVAARAIGAGQMVVAADVRSPAAPNGLRAISIPIDPEHAVGGALIAGDRIDLISVTEEASTYVLADVEVLAVPAEARSSLTGAGGYYLVVAVNADQALAVADAIRGGQVEIVRATGSTVIEVEP
ncbi:MAG: RcpC/CpaB family pilus assembly protein, partial [Actinomycetota bacterium]|nr:RcpC/CpaB family pilus assembly protein [Actinomycetota bacterium]